MSKNKVKRIVWFVLCIMLVFVSWQVSVSGVQDDTVFLRDGGNGDGSTYENAMGDFKEAVRTLSKTGGNIVICGEYTYNELILLSEKSGTSNGNRTITVTSVYGGNDYRTTDNAMLCAGDENGSANMILGGSFVFENLNIVTNGSNIARAVICGGYDTVFGEGIVCKKQGNAPYISIVGVSLNDYVTANCQITVKSGTYNYVCAGNRDGGLTGNTTLIIDGGTFEGSVSATGITDSHSDQKGNASMVINGGSFSGSVGAVTPLTEEFFMTVNGGTFRKDITALGKYNTVEINGGTMQNISYIKIADYIEAPPETDDDGETVETEESDVKKTVVNLNNYSGDVKKLVEKIQGQGVVVNINTLGGIDVETTAASETAEPTPETDKPELEETAEKDAAESEHVAEEKTYFLGSQKRTIVAGIGIGVMMFLAIVMLAYRSVYRKK